VGYVYYDGVQVASQSVTQWNTIQSSFYFGSRCDLLNSYFFGQIDDISIYNRALSPTEINQIYTDQTSTVATPPCPTLATNLQTGLVGYWPFCGNANDESGNGNNGTVNGATLTADRFGNANSAYSFNNNNTEYIEISESPELNNCPEITVSFWTKVLSWSQYNMFIGKTGNNATTWNILSDNANGNVLIFRKTSAPAMPQDYLSSIGVPSFGTWHHLVFSYSFNGSSGSCKFYLDGSLIETYTNTNYLGISNYPIRIGSDGTAVANTVDGFMDDVAIYNRALTPTEITQLYTNPSVTPPVACTPFLGEDQTVCAGTSVTLTASSTASSTTCPTLPSTLQTGLVGYWPFCGNANDASGNGNNGTVNGATLTTDRFGNANSAYSFDGNDGIDCGNSSMLDLTSNYSVAYWYQKNGSDMGAVLSKNNGAGGQNKYVLGVNQYGSNGDFCHWHNGPAPQWRYTGIPIDAQWNFIVWKFNGQTIELYKNGVFVQSFLLDPTFPQISANMIIGNTEGIMFWNGKIDELMMFNRQLSQEEIQQLYTL
jgi:hypothetical protein